MTFNSKLSSTAKFFLIVFTLNVFLVNAVFSQDDSAEKANKEKIKPKEDPYTSITLFMNVLQMVRENYVDEGKVTYERLITGALKGMIHALDPFSAYEEPARYKNTKEQTEGQFGGLGIHITFKNNVLEVVAPMEDTPAFKAGIMPGDIIIGIDGTPIRSMSLNDSVKLLKGPPKSTVTLTIYRKSQDMTKDFTMERAIIRTPSVKGAKIIEDGIGYIRVTQFARPTAGKFLENLKKLKKEGLRGLIIDLRHNPGGLLYSAIEICSFFLKRGELVVFTVGRRPVDRKEFRALNCDKTLDVPIVILVDDYSASASEIVAGCLQDHKRAVLVGERTFGKGSVQSIVPLANKGAVRFTTAKYYTPSKKVIHGHGIEPDIPVQLTTNTENFLARQRALFPGVIKPRSRNSITDVQLKRAVEILKGICLFSEAKNEK